MPGIVGIISKRPEEINKRELTLMIDCMMYETFYTNGMYFNNEMGLYAGWVCHKGSFSDCMPVFNEKKDLVLLFSGENFTDKEVIKQLKTQGHEFEKSNASYLIHLYEAEGDEFLVHLNGWFSGIIVDIRKGKVILFNDRYGMQRIYYHESKEAFLFSSEAKSLLKIRPELRKIDLESMGQFFSCDCTLQNRTLFSNVFLLPSASAWTFCNGNNVKKNNYFKPSIWENQPVLGKAVFYKRLRETFLNILPRYFCSEVPIGMSLTGGLDTRMIMSNIDYLPDGLPCYTFGSMYRDCFDVLVARKVADSCHQPHHVLRLNEKLFSDFPSYAEKTIYITDGCHDVCGAHDLYFNKLAREIAPIRMTGKFGSEVIRDVRSFKAISPCEKLFHPDFKKYVKGAVQTFANISRGNNLSFAVFKNVPRHEYGCLAMEQSQLTLRTPYMDNDLVSLMYQAPPDTIGTREFSLRLIADGNPTLLKIMTDRGIKGSSNYLISKCSQLFYWSLFKTEWFYNYMPNWLARITYILKPFHIEKLILGRQVIIHYRKWFHNEISDYIREILLDKRTANREYLNKNFLEKIVYSHIKGNSNYMNEINKTLTVELIQRIFIENI